MDIFQNLITNTSLHQYSCVHRWNVSEDGTIRRGTNFLSLPIELRNMIYEFYFAMSEYIPVPGESLLDPAPWRKLEPQPTVFSTHYVRDWDAIPPEPMANAKAISANKKIPLLQTSKAVYRDARPFLYLHHTFAFARGNWNFRSFYPDLGPLQETNYQPLEWLTKVELTNNERYFPNPYGKEEKVDVYRQLLELEKHCPRLRHFLLVLYFWRGPKHHAFDFLSDFSDNLSYLEIRVQGWHWCSGPLASDLERIAPLRHWTNGGMKTLEGYTIWSGVRRPVHNIQQNTYTLDRSKIAEQEGSLPDFEREGPYLRLMRHPSMTQA